MRVYETLLSSLDYNTKIFNKRLDHVLLRSQAFKEINQLCDLLHDIIDTS